jgi:hypothetical protein
MTFVKVGPPVAAAAADVAVLVLLASKLRADLPCGPLAFSGT